MSGPLLDNPMVRQLVMLFFASRKVIHCALADEVRALYSVINKYWLSPQSVPDVAFTLKGLKNILRVF